MWGGEGGERRKGEGGRKRENEEKSEFFEVNKMKRANKSGFWGVGKKPPQSNGWRREASPKPTQSTSNVSREVVKEGRGRERSGEKEKESDKDKLR